MNTIQKDKVLSLELEEKALYELLLNTEKEYETLQKDFPYEPELYRKVDNEIAHYYTELKKLKEKIKYFIGASCLTYSERLECGYKESDCEYICVQDDSESQIWQQVIYKGRQKTLENYDE